MNYRFVSFTTDYGMSDGFVAACHGVLLRVNPTVHVLDVTHAVPPQNIRHGAAVLAQTLPYLPPAVHLAVVDPGVGGSRRPVVVVTGRGLLVGPDNGLLIPAAETLGEIQAAYELSAPEYRLPTVSATFHGRDVFAPAAAHLTRGVRPEAFGPEVSDLVRLPDPQLRIDQGLLTAEITMIDAFGNIQLDADQHTLAAAQLPDKVTVHYGQSTMDAQVGRTFADVPPGSVVVHVDSANRVAIAVRDGSAADLLGYSTSSDSPHSVTISSSPTDSLPGRTTAAFAPNATPPDDARR